MTRPSHLLPAVFAAAALLLAGIGCERCGNTGTGTAADATTQRPPQAEAEPADAGPKERGLPATDLRSALILVHPEFRYARISGERAGIERDVSLPADRPLLAALKPGLEARRFINIREEGGAVLAENPPLLFEARRGAEGKDADVVTQSLMLKLEEEPVRKIYHSPSPMGSEHLSSLMPAPEGGTVLRERFILNLRYGARPDHASFLVRELVEGLLQTGWVVQDAEPPRWEEKLTDGGLDTVPHEVDLALEQTETGGRFTIDRRVGRVILRYTQPLLRAEARRPPPR